MDIASCFFDNFDLNVDEAAELLAHCMIEGGEIVVKGCKPWPDFWPTRNSKEIAPHIEKYKQILIKSIEKSQLKTIVIKRDLHNDSIDTSETRIGFRKFSDWTDERNVPKADCWNEFMNNYHDIYYEARNEYLFRRELYKNRELSKKLSDLSILKRDLSVQELEKVSKKALYELCRYLVVQISSIENGEAKIEEIKENYDDRGTSLRAIGYMAILLAIKSNKYKCGESVNKSQIKAVILELIKKISVQNKDGDEAPSTYGLHRLDKKIGDGVNLVITESGSTLEKVLQMQI